MTTRTVNAGARLDRLPLSAFHQRIFWLIGAGMFFDGYDLYVGTTVLGSLIKPTLLPRMVVGAVTLISINTLIFGFVTWLPTFFVQQGLSVAQSFGYTLVIVLGSPIGCALGAFSADSLGRRRSILIASVLTIVLGAIYPFMGETSLVLTVGFLLIVSIYVQVAILFGVYTPELFPTEVRLRANGIVNTLGRAATVVSPFLVVGLFGRYGVSGVLGLMIGLLIVQIAVVAAWGIEPAKRPLEDLEAESTPAARPAPGLTHPQAAGRR